MWFGRRIQLAAAVSYERGEFMIKNFYLLQGNWLPEQAIAARTRLMPISLCQHLKALYNCYGNIWQVLRTSLRFTYSI
jgi:hypothetical protein